MHCFSFRFNEDKQRLFTVEIDGGVGEVVLEIDVFPEAGGKNQALKLIQEDIRAVEGLLTIVFSPIVGNSIVAALALEYVQDHYAHAVTGGPYFAFDDDDDGFEVVPVNADQSHTHGPNNNLTSAVWTTGPTVLGSGLRTELTLPFGDTNVQLTVSDTKGSVSRAETVIRVASMVVFSLLPTQGPDTGGTMATITGRNIGGATAVRCGPNTISRGNFAVVNSGAISFVTPASGVGVTVNVSVVDPRGESNSTSFTYISATAISFDENLLMEIENPTAVGFGPDGYLYVGTQYGSLSRVTLNDSYDSVIDIFTKMISPERSILGIAFNPLETHETSDISVYISTSTTFHKCVLLD